MLICSIARPRPRRLDTISVFAPLPMRRRTKCPSIQRPRLRAPAISSPIIPEPCARKRDGTQPRTVRKSDRTTSVRGVIHDAAHTKMEGMHEESEVEDVCFLSSTTCLVRPLPHSYRSLRLENRVSWQGLSPGLLREGVARSQIGKDLTLRRLSGRFKQLTLKPLRLLEMHLELWQQIFRVPFHVGVHSDSDLIAEHLNGFLLVGDHHVYELPVEFRPHQAGHPVDVLPRVGRSGLGLRHTFVLHKTTHIHERCREIALAHIGQISHPRITG